MLLLLLESLSLYMGEKDLTRPVWKGGSETLEVDFILQAKIKKEIPGGIVLVEKPTFQKHSSSQSLRILL